MTIFEILIYLRIFYSSVDKTVKKSQINLQVKKIKKNELKFQYIKFRNRKA